MEKIKNYFQLHRKNYFSLGIQTTIMVAMSTVTFIIAILIGVILYQRYSRSLSQLSVLDTQQIIEQASRNFEGNLKDIRQISDTAYYNVIQEHVVGSQEFAHDLSLLYDTNQNEVVTIALYNQNGSLISAEPVSQQKEDPNVTQQKWFLQATSEIENLHFSTPHIQNLFEDSSHKYHWVVSVSRAVDITNQGEPEMGVLLVDLDYSIISDVMEQLNDKENGQYVYLADRDGNLIYHPKAVQIQRGFKDENQKKIVALDDGIYSDRLNGENRQIIVGTVAYTGWRLVGVIPESASTPSIRRFRYFIFAALTLLIMMMLLVNRIVAKRISSPITRLSESVKDYEAGSKPSIYIGGSSEIRHLGLSVQKSYEQIDELMKEIVKQQNKRRKSEIAALQSQINPHFLYNTLDSITWMIESGRDQEAVTMISELARLLRISLSKGRTIISLEDEFQHSKSYMNIQKVRYKERFQVEFDIEPEVMQCATVKLIVQPVLENAIYYGVGEMDSDDEGKIIIRGQKKGEDIYISVIDNGFGMSQETINEIFSGKERKSKRGSGVGIINVHTRIQLLFGPEYGLSIESELDEGTTVTLHLPAIPFTEENRKRLEQDMEGKEAK